jgi:hypothetical protein
MNLAQKIKADLTKDLDYSQIEKYLTELFMKGKTRVRIEFQYLYLDRPDAKIGKTIYGEYLEVNGKYFIGFADWVRQNGFNFIKEGCGFYYVTLP